MTRTRVLQSIAAAWSLLLFIDTSAVAQSLRADDGASRTYRTVEKRSFARQMLPTRPTRAKAGSTRAPIAFQIYCLRNVDACRSAPSAKIAHSEKSMSKLHSINIAVNRSIRPRHDRGADTWTDKAKSGDCEDFVLAKRRKLIEQGFPIGALRIAVARTNRGEGHAVLVVRTSGGEVVLDNRTDTIKPWSRTDLTRVAMSGANPLQWR